MRTPAFGVKCAGSLLALAVLVSACGPAALTTGSAAPVTLSTPNPLASQTPTPFQPAVAQVIPSATGIPSGPSSPVSSKGVWISPAVPDGLAQALAAGQPLSPSPESAAVRLDIAPAESETGSKADWIYALVAAFPTVIDDVSLAALRSAWAGESGQRLILAESTREALSSLWGKPGQGAVLTVQPNELTEALWQERAAWGIVPFDELNPRLKVLSLDGISPLQKGFDAASYPLKVTFALEGAALPALSLPATNRDPTKMTVLVMTGVTALVRATAARMEQKGVLYPGRDIRDWLREADVTHISNEVSFAQNCPPPDPNTTSLIFCSSPAYLALLQDVGTDVVELSGNHMLDWGPEPFLETLQTYRQNNMAYYAGGANAAEAQQALTLEDHGNKLAFIGCNPVGPGGDWATETRPGSAYCGDYGWMKDELTSLRAQGYIPIATLQYNEYYQAQPYGNQAADFGRLAEAGALIVSGSQAHFPQAFAFDGGSFIHYGLGNLFFDQMDIPVPGTRREFLDRYIIYDGRVLSVELLTAMLEDWARPRPMTPTERSSFLQEIFSASGW